MGEPKPDWQIRAEEVRRERWTRLIDKETRARILARDYPGRLEWPDPCPVDAGDEIPLHRDVTVIVNRPRAVDKNDHSQGWRTTYTVRDLRPEFLLRRVPPEKGPKKRDLVDGEVPPPRPGEIEKARIESSYTSTVVGAVPEAGEGIDPDWHDRGKEERNALRLQAVEELRAEEEARRAEEEARAWLIGVIRQVPPAQRVAFIKQLRAGAGHLLEEYLDEAA